MKRLAEFLIGIGAVLGLAVSSVSAACSCSHHRESSTPAHSCHQETAGHPEKILKSSSLVVDERCICIPQTAKLSVKSEGFKLKKHPGRFPVSLAIPAGLFYASGVASISVLASSGYRPQFFGEASSRGPPLA
jgi:hypothetical protein